jgi:hypothetical protein
MRRWLLLPLFACGGAEPPRVCDEGDCREWCEQNVSDESLDLSHLAEDRTLTDVEAGFLNGRLLHVREGPRVVDPSGVGLCTGGPTCPQIVEPPMNRLAEGVYEPFLDLTVPVDGTWTLTYVRDCNAGEQPSSCDIEVPRVEQTRELRGLGRDRTVEVRGLDRFRAEAGDTCARNCTATFRVDGHAEPFERTITWLMGVRRP